MAFVRRRRRPTKRGVEKWRRRHPGSTCIKVLTTFLALIVGFRVAVPQLSQKLPFPWEGLLQWKQSKLSSKSSVVIGLANNRDVDNDVTEKQSDHQSAQHDKWMNVDSSHSPLNKETQGNGLTNAKSSSSKERPGNDMVNSTSSLSEKKLEISRNAEVSRNEMINATLSFATEMLGNPLMNAMPSSESETLNVLMNVTTSLETEAPGNGATSPFKAEIPVYDNAIFVNASTLDLPDWFKDYIEFHRNSIQNLNVTNWKSNHYLILRCYHHEGCGGASDRIKGIPLYLFLAQKSHRILFIRWQHPHALERFLLPVAINWTLPDWMNAILDDSNRTEFTKRFVLVRSMKHFRVLEAEALSNNWIVLETLAKVGDRVGERYSSLTGNGLGDFGPEYHDIWRAMFRPSPAVGDLLLKFFQRTGLTPGHYAVAHQRALYGSGKAVPTSEISSHAVNAVNCASQLLPGAPIFFASDSLVGITAIQDYAKATNRSIVTGHDDLALIAKEPLHLDVAKGRNIPPAPEYYATFVDLWIMGSGRCVAYNIGGFGVWGSLIGYNKSCILKYNKEMNCTWADK